MPTVHELPEKASLENRVPSRARVTDKTTAMTKLEFHPVADLFPLMQGAEFDALVEDIRKNGLREPLWRLKDGTPLDGRNRCRACGEAGVKLRWRVYTGPDDGLVDFVMSMNLHRRQLNGTQQAMVGARLATMKHGGDRSKGSIDPLKSIDDAAALLNVSGPTVKRARKVLERGAPALIDACDQGKVTVSDAARIVDLPAPDQDLIVQRVTTGLAKTLAGARRTLDIERQRRAIAEGTAKMPEGVFEVIVIDPPWPYGNEDDYDPEYRCLTTPYPEKSLEEIAAIELPAADDCVLWLWTTQRFLLRDVSPLLDAWGFKDKAIITWDKESIGMGRWLQFQSEFCVMAVKGHPLVDLRGQGTIIRAPRREHSRKPDKFYKMVESLCLGRRLDMFSRERRIGWEQFGNDLNKFKRAA